jgi:hypothetical protein
MDEDRFDGMTQAIADCQAAHARACASLETLGHQDVRKGSRRGVLGGLMAMVLQGLMPASTQAGCRAKEGKDQRQCRRRQRKNTPGGILDCPDLKSCTFLPGAPDAWPITLGPLPGGTAGQCWSWAHFGCYPCQNTREYYNTLCQTTYASTCHKGTCVAST